MEGRSPETHNHYRSAIKFFYKKVLKILWDDDTVPAMKRERNLPAALTRNEINAIIDATTNLKHKAIIATMGFFHQEIKIQRLPYAETSLAVKNTFSG